MPQTAQWHLILSKTILRRYKQNTRTRQRTWYTTRLHRNDLIDYDTFKYLSSNSDPKTGRFYILPKIHKQGNPGRPIISSNSHPTEPISEFTVNHLKPLVQTIPSHIKDTTYFLLQLEKLRPLPDNALLVTPDQFPNIPHIEVIDVCHHFLNTRQDKSLPVESICDLVRMILTMNNFSFNNEHYLQVHGTAMRTRMAPSLSVVQYTQTESNGMDWQSVSIPLVKCISLPRMSTVAKSLWCHWYQSYQWCDRSVHWHTIGEMHLITWLRGLRLFPLPIRLSTVGFWSSISANGTFGTNGVT